MLLGIRLSVLALALALAACVRSTRVGSVPALLLGDFDDDYGGHHRISTQRWEHGSSLRYHIVRWNAKQQYLVAQNDSTNPGGAGQWTRIDWMRLEGMPPYEWAFCLSAWKAPTAVAAESTRVAQRSTPRTGCGGFPFSRMRRAGAP